MIALPPVVDKVMSCFALGLGFPEDFFEEVGAGFCALLDMQLTRSAACIAEQWPEPQACTVVYVKACVGVARECGDSKGIAMPMHVPANARTAV